MNYTQLATAIQDYTRNDEATFVTHIPDFVKAAEKRIFDATQLLVARKNATSSTSNGSPYLQTPLDFMAPFSMAIISSGTHYPVLITDETFMREVYPTAATGGRPEHYAMFDHNTFIFGPTPDAIYSVELHYFYYPESITSATTTWLGDNAEHALLWGSLIEANVYMKGEQDVHQMYMERYQDALQGLKLLSAGRDRGDAYRYGQFRTTPQA